MKIFRYLQRNLIYYLIFLLIIYGVISFFFELFDNSVVTRSDLCWTILVLCFLFSGGIEREDLEEFDNKLNILESHNHEAQEKIDDLYEWRTSPKVRNLFSTSQDLEKIAIETEKLKETVEWLTEELNTYLGTHNPIYQCECGELIRESNMSFIEDEFHSCKACCRDLAYFEFKELGKREKFNEK